MLISSSSFDRVAANIFFVFALLPFASPYPVNTDVQPLAASFALMVYFIRIFTSKKIPKKLCYVLFISILALLFINPFEQIDWQIGKVGALFLGLITLLFIYQLHSYFSPKVFNIVVKIYFLLSILFLLFPNAIVSFQSLIVRKMNVTEFGYRGISTLSTEPGLFGGLLVGFLAINLYFYREKKLQKLDFRINSVLLFVMIILTKSGSGYMYLFIYILMTLISSLNMKRAVKSGIIISILSLVLFTQTSKNHDIEQLGRGVHTFVNLMSSPELLIKDRSIVYRLYAVYVAVISFTENPMGVGHASVKSVSQTIVDENPKLSHFYDSYNEYFHPVSSFGFYLTAYGIFFILLIFLVLVKLKPTLPFLTLALIYLFFSYSIAFPITWLLLVLGAKVKK